MKKTLVILVFYIFSIQTIASDETLEIRGNKTKIEIRNSFELTKTIGSNTWQNIEQFVKLRLYEESNNIEQFKKETLQKINASANQFLLAQQLSIPPNTFLFTTTKIISESQFREYIFLGGESNNLFQLTITHPDAHSEQYAVKVESMLNSLVWQPAISPLFDDLPFYLPELLGFKITQKYANSLVLKGNQNDGGIDAFLVVSVMPETPRIKSLVNNTLGVIQSAQSLKDVEILNIADNTSEDVPNAVVRASAEMIKENLPVDILLTGFIRDNNYMIMQMMVEKATVSFLRMEDLLMENINNVQFKQQ